MNILVILDFAQEDKTAKLFFKQAHTIFNERGKTIRKEPPVRKAPAENGLNVLRDTLPCSSCLKTLTKNIVEREERGRT